MLLIAKGMPIHHTVLTLNQPCQRNHENSKAFNQRFCYSDVENMIQDKCEHADSTITTSHGDDDAEDGLEMNVG